VDTLYDVSGQNVEFWNDKLGGTYSDHWTLHCYVVWATTGYRTVTSLLDDGNELWGSVTRGKRLKCHITLGSTGKGA